MVVILVGSDISGHVATGLNMKRGWTSKAKEKIAPLYIVLELSTYSVYFHTLIICVNEVN